MMLLDSTQPRADALVLFGATGDLAKRKLFPALYHLERTGQLDVPVIGVARSRLDRRIVPSARPTSRSSPPSHTPTQRYSTR